MSFTTVLGFRDAVDAAAELDAFDGGTHDEYSRGQAELIQALFTRDDTDPGSGEAYEYIRGEILRARK